MRAISSAQYFYYKDFQRFADNYADLGPDVYLENVSLVNASITSSSYTAATAKSGYFYASNLNYFEQEFVLFATPSSYGSSGRYTYLTNFTGLALVSSPFLICLVHRAIKWCF